MKKKMGFLFFGMIFGFTLSRVGASEYDLIYYMFTAENLKLAAVIGSAIVVGFIGMQLLKFLGNRTVSGDMMQVKKRPLSWLNALGGIIFGIGWGMSGACPGTILAQVGEGKILGLYTLAGILVGTYIYAYMYEKFKFLNPK